VVLPVVVVAASAADGNNSGVPFATTRYVVTTHISVNITSTTAAIATSICETSSDWPPCTCLCSVLVRRDT